VLLGALSAASSVHAGDLPRLVVHRSDDALDCPDARTLADLVAEQMQKPALQPAVEGAPDAARGLDVQIYRSEKGFTAVIQAKGKTRKISDKGATCSSLAAALAVSISILLDDDPVPPAPEPPAPPPAPTPPLSTMSWDTHPAEPPDEEPPPPPMRPRVVLAAAPMITVGLLQSWAGAVTSEIEVRLGRFSVSGGVLVLPGQTLTAGSGAQVSLDLMLGLIRGCATVADRETLRLALCVTPYAGAIHGETKGLPNNQSSTTPWIGAGTSFFFEQKIWGPLAWGARAELMIPLDKWQFNVDNGTLFSPAPAGGAWDAELRVSIW
jgi:hypothetical protein